jgi:hypothetical protein
MYACIYVYIHMHAHTYIQWTAIESFDQGIPVTHTHTYIHTYMRAHIHTVDSH